jgi:hypothetical protein
MPRYQGHSGVPQTLLGPSHRPPKGWGLISSSWHMAFNPRRSDFIEAVRFATIVLSFGMVGYIVFFR